MLRRSEPPSWSRSPVAPRVVLVGVPGSGKTTVGTLLSARLNVEFRDTDRDIEAAQGKSVSDIFVDSGEPEFRALERDAVARALVEHDGVLALGGGAVIDAATRELLLAHPTVWLQVGPSAGAHRVGLDVPRPVLLGNVRGRLATLVAERAPLYAEVASITVDTDRRTPDEVADEIVAALGLEPTDD
jgi:shikimate kinase